MSSVNMQADSSRYITTNTHMMDFADALSVGIHVPAERSAKSLWASSAAAFESPVGGNGTQSLIPDALPL